ncbi:MAG: hypothetical protein COA42_06845 [Alteromonadaceae bacterium]|nr:MAG: hypothetical protein COA42_06845 [Alteromonadaceae bacterium]
MTDENFDDDSSSVSSVVMPGTGQVGDASPVEREVAINAWHAALARTIAYAWENWDDDNEIDNIVLYPDYYLKQFGFESQIPAYKTKVKFVIKKDDRVKFKHGNCKSGGSLVVETGSGKKVSKDLKPVPNYESRDNSTVTIKSIKNIRKEYEKIYKNKYHDFDEYFTDKYMSYKNGSLTNGWHYEDLSDLTGCFIVAIPAKPKNPENEMQALNDFMELCTNQPFTCA